MELFSEKEWSWKKKWFVEIELYRNIDSFRRCKSRKFWGELLVVIGVGIEIITGGCSAVKDWNNWRRERVNESINLPVSDISADMILTAKGPSDGTQPQVGPLDCWMELSETNMNRATLALGKFHLLFSDKIVSCDQTGNGFQNHGYTIRQFQSSPLYGGDSTTIVLDNWNPVTPRIFMDRIKVLKIHLPFLSEESEIIDGRVDMTVNNFSEEFQIYSQKIDKDLCLYATNSVP